LVLFGGDFFHPVGALAAEHPCTAQSQHPLAAGSGKKVRGIPLTLASSQASAICAGGDYSWRQNKRVEKGGFRPLRIPPEP
jgi:hypothetical protein